ncbi:tripartite tricarboxylate transporter substrate-binding protein [Bradyrhizobium sp. CER78]|uniref:tripartite tricarboxylate transporter substrate-binding protein n=1 Tax=Bradyrhizobium sp. CER78 TaxID=3039162 RepID=UPI002447428B|nr:tripartite tricarboxylate transporter substrate-binding protein [Bradyrhizobium sp. CER78]MDH2386162.1 tripartite tricarboxylate transporter substrate-binding protein [Bradyrhizobium sp. CER78]
MNGRKSILLLASLVSALAAFDCASGADGNHGGPVKIVVPYPAGGPADFVGRIVAQKLSEKAGARYYVENQPGAGGAIGAAAVAHAPADGRTILLMNQDFVVEPAVKAKVPFDPFKDFAPVVEIATAPEMISVNPSLPASSMQELIALLKANPGKYNYATPGYGTSPHLGAEWLFKLTYGLDVVAIPFQGAVPAVQATLAGDTQIIPIVVTAVAPLIADGKLRGLAIAAHKRSPVVPDVPTLEEQGIQGHEIGFWIGAMVPAGTPTAIVDLLHDQIAEAMAQPEVQKRLAEIGFEPAVGTTQDFMTFIKAESDKWKKVVSDAHVHID